jgi:hypothetical protein
MVLPLRSDGIVDATGGAFIHGFLLSNSSSIGIFASTFVSPDTSWPLLKLARETHFSQNSPPCSVLDSDDEKDFLALELNFRSLELSKDEDSELESSHPIKGNADEVASCCCVNDFLFGSRLRLKDSLMLFLSILSVRDLLVLLLNEHDCSDLMVSNEPRIDALRFCRRLRRLSFELLLLELRSDFFEVDVACEFLDEALDRNDPRDEQKEAFLEDRNAARSGTKSHTIAPSSEVPFTAVSFPFPSLFSSSSELSPSSSESGQAINEP